MSIVSIRGQKKRSKNKGLFSPAKYRYLSNIITHRSVEGALIAVKKLDDEWKNAKTRAKKRRLIWAVNRERGIIRATLRRQDLMPSTKQKLRDVYRIYAKWSDSHRLEVKKK